MLRRRCLVPLSLIFGLSACGPWPGDDDGAGIAADAAAAGDAEAVLAEVGEDWYALNLREEPWQQQLAGAPIRMPDLGPDHAEELIRQTQAMLDRLSTVDESALEHADWLTLETLRWDLERFVEWRALRHRSPLFTPYMFNGIGPHGVLRAMRIESPEDAEAYLALASDYAGMAGDLLGVARAQVDHQWVVAEPALDQLIGMWTSHAENPQASIFAACAEPASLAEEVPADFCERLDAVVQAEVVPALQEFVDYLAGPYREAAPAEVGLGRYPGGDEVYRALVRYFVTYDVDPQEAHQRGLRMLESARARMAELRPMLGLPDDAAKAHELLKKDPRVLARSPEDVEERLMVYIERLKPRLAEAFDLMPRAPYGLKRLDPSLEGSKTYGHYDPPTPQEERGLYYYNGSRLDERPLITAASLIYHELIPGHHFQVALQMENEDLPRWRSEVAFHSGFTEGWAEYGSSLMMEMGLYETPLDEYGRLASECFFGNRLVVDTGMHAMGWTLEEAREASRRNTLMSDLEIQTETLRYSTDLQAQALAYALGAAKIRDLRERAKSELGAAFDLRAFHRTVLENGSVPLSVLEKHVDWWIEQQRSGSRDTADEGEQGSSSWES